MDMHTALTEMKYIKIKKSGFDPDFFFSLQKYKKNKKLNLYNKTKNSNYYSTTTNNLNNNPASIILSIERGILHLCNTPLIS